MRALRRHASLEYAEGRPRQRHFGYTPTPQTHERHGATGSATEALGRYRPPSARTHQTTIRGSPMMARSQPHSGHKRWRSREYGPTIGESGLSGIVIAHRWCAVVVNPTPGQLRADIAKERTWPNLVRN